MAFPIGNLPSGVSKPGPVSPSESKPPAGPLDSPSEVKPGPASAPIPPDSYTPSIRLQQQGCQGTGCQSCGPGYLGALANTFSFQ